MSGRLALDMSPEWKALYFPPADRIDVAKHIPDGFILGVRALNRRSWRVWLMTDHPVPHKRVVVWKMDHVANVTGKEAALFSLRKMQAHPDPDAA